jgi:activating signal cointegrator complex subunit 1
MSARQRLTHFLCIPLATSASRPQLQVSFETFASDVIGKAQPKLPHGLPPQAIRPVGSLHLTLGIMSLLGKDHIDRALSLLERLDLKNLLSQASTDSSLSPDTIGSESSQQLESDGLRVTLHGLKSIYNPTNTSVLFAPPLDPSGQLQRFCKSIQKAFADEDLLMLDSRPLLLHATIVNTVYVPGVRDLNISAGYGSRKAKMTFDARDILERYEGFTWMRDVAIEKVAICRMGAKKVVDENGMLTGDEAYFVEGSVDFE